MKLRWNNVRPDSTLEGIKAKPTASIWGPGAGSQASSLHFRSKDKNVLDIPSYRSGVWRLIAGGRIEPPHIKFFVLRFHFLPLAKALGQYPILGYFERGCIRDWWSAVPETSRLHKEVPSISGQAAARERGCWLETE